MKKILLMILSALFILALASGCSSKTDNKPPAGTPAASEATQQTPAEEPAEEPDEEPAAEAPQGELCEAEKFTIIAPEGWKILELPDASGFHLYKSSGEVVQIQYTGSNLKDEAAKNSVTYFAENNDGTEAVEVEMLGKVFWATTYEYSGEEQALYKRIEDGVELSVQTAKGNYENNEEYRAILDSVVFK